MTVIYLIRHTQAEGNLYRMMQGHWDGDVTPLGYRQIDALAERFRTVPLDAVYASDLRRAVLTAEGAARHSGLPVQPDARLRELNVGPWEGQFFGNICHTDPERIELFMHSPGDWQLPGAETLADVTERAYPALCEIAERHPGHAVAVVSHGITIRCLLSRILNRPLSGQEPVPIVRNTAVTKLLYEDGVFTPEYLADDSHAAHLEMADWVANDGLRDAPFDPSADLPLYLKCYEDAWSAAHGGDRSAFRPELYSAAALRHWKQDPGAIRKLYHEDRSVGLVDLDTAHGAEQGVGWISLLYLLPEYRNRGYGVQLLGRAVVRYRALGRHALQLHAAPSNPAALRFYEKCGFARVGSEVGASGPLAVLEKPLGGAGHVH